MLITLEERYKIGKSLFPKGEWDNEPDYILMVDEETWTPCLIMRSDMGNLCGYIGVFECHPWYDMNYNEIPLECYGGGNRKYNNRLRY